MLLFGLQIDGCLNKITYCELIDYLFSICDYITFKIPDYNNVVITDKNKHLVNPDDIINPNDYLECYEIYKENAVNILNIIVSDLVYSYKNEEYAGNIGIYLNDIYCFRLSENVKKFLKINDNFYDWQYPGYPEDVCFYKDKKCFMRTVAHENLCFIYGSIIPIMKILKKHNVSFSIICKHK